MNKAECVDILKRYLKCEQHIHNCNGKCDKCKCNYYDKELHNAVKCAVDILSAPTVETNMFDEVEEYHNCFVQVLHNSITDEYSVGWRKE